MFTLLALTLVISQPPIACNLNALNHAERERLYVMLDRLTIAATNREELPDGYTWRIDRSKMSFTEVAEWISLESRCCPFLIFEIDLSANGRLQFRLTGGPGVKHFIAAEMHKLPN